MDSLAPAPFGRLGRAALRSRWMDALLRWRARDILAKAQLDRHLPASGLFLDLGAGLGHLAEAVRHAPAAADRRCVAMDPVWSPPPPLAARLQQGGPGWVQFLHADGAALPFAANSFDAAWCAFVLHHLRPAQQARVLAEIARVLRPGGTFLLIEDTPVIDATLHADRRLNFEDDSAPHHYRDPAGWLELLAIQGLKTIGQTAFTAIFPRATLRRIPHRLFICQAA